MFWTATVFILLFQKLSGSHKALVEMQDDVSELLRSATREYKQTKVCVKPHLYTLSYKCPITRWLLPCTHFPSRPQAVLCYCSISDDRISLWMGPNHWPAEKWSAPVHIKICWQPTWDLHYVHFCCIRLSLALVNTTLRYCPVLVLTLCWPRHKWELTPGTERGIFPFTYPNTEKCAEVVETFISGNQTHFPLEL